MERKDGNIMKITMRVQANGVKCFVLTSIETVSLKVLLC